MDGVTLSEWESLTGMKQAELNELLMNLGLKSAFDDTKADFGRAGAFARRDPLYISLIKQNTHISVEEKGTEAGAATAVMMDPNPSRIWIVKK